MSVRGRIRPSDLRGGDGDSAAARPERDVPFDGSRPSELGVDGVGRLSVRRRALGCCPWNGGRHPATGPRTACTLESVSAQPLEQASRHGRHLGADCLAEAGAARARTARREPGHRDARAGVYGRCGTSRPLRPRGSPCGAASGAHATTVARVVARRGRVRSSPRRNPALPSGHRGSRASPSQSHASRGRPPKPAAPRTGSLRDLGASASYLGSPP